MTRMHTLQAAHFTLLLSVFWGIYLCILSEGALVSSAGQPLLSLLTCAQRGWQVQNNLIHFQPMEEQAASEGPPPLKLISNALMYAKELERIV